MQQIEKIMLQAIGKDLKQFKKPFLNRRINARMRTVGVRDGSEYAKLLESDSREPFLLFKSFSINVTAFYRDEFVWQCLSSQIIPKILQDTTLPLKVWCAGCASGEEPYSLAILFKESVGKSRKFSIIGNDINTDALQLAKKGQFAPLSLKNLTPELIAKYFVKLDNNKYEISDEIKQLVTLEHGDIMSVDIDRANLISCRNVLIYYDKSAQDLLFKRFHNTLTKNGYLVIGQDETMLGVGASKLFSCVLPRERIYTKVSQ